MLRATVLPDALAPAVGLVEMLIGNIDLPEGDPKLQAVAREVAIAVGDLVKLKDETDATVLEVARRSVELRLTRKLDELGLLKGH